MSNPIIIIDNNLELVEIEKQHPELINAPLILLSSNFSPLQLRSFQDRGYTWFDEEITTRDVQRMSSESEHLIWNWFLDDSGQDLSKVGGCSLGATFASSMSVVTSYILRYQCGLGKLLNSTHTVYHSARTRDIFSDTCVYLQEKIGFTRHSIESDELKKLSQSFDLSGRQKNLNNLFDRKKWKSRILAKLLNFIYQKRGNKEKRVMMMIAGKLDSYISHIQTQGCPNEFRWVFPFSTFSIGNLGIGNLLRNGRKLVQYYTISTTKADHSDIIDSVIYKLKQNLSKNHLSIDPELLIRCMERNTFAYFSGALEYYHGAKRLCEEYQPDLVIVPNDGYETYILILQAAKHCEIQTALCPHGIYIWGFAEYKTGSHQVLDQFFAYGKMDFNNHHHVGVSQENIKVTSFPYFERFLPTKAIVNSDKYRYALILAPDILSHCPGEKIDKYYTFFEDVYYLLKQLGIEIIAIKVRHKLYAVGSDLSEETIEIGEEQIKILTGYSDFPDAAKMADLVIGPVSTALMESGLMGKDYYVYQHTPYHEYTSSILPKLFDIVNASFSMEHLRTNITRKQPYRAGCSVYDIVDMKDVKDREDLFRKYEAGVASAIIG